jgi:RNA polymerase sigma-70 factor (ECF subfamily)
MGAHSLRLASVARGTPAAAMDTRREAMAASDARLREVVEQHLDLVWRVLRRAGLAVPDAEDASQDVFWVLAQRIDSVPQRAQRSFLVSTALRVASDRKRSRWHRSVRSGLDPEEYEGPGLSADEQLDLRRGAALLDRALATLDEEDRAVYVLAELEQLSRSEVSEVLAIPQGTVATRLKRARDACLAALRRLHRGGAP